MIPAVTAIAVAVFVLVAGFALTSPAQKADLSRWLAKVTGSARRTYAERDERGRWMYLAVDGGRRFVLRQPGTREQIIDDQELGRLTEEHFQALGDARRARGRWRRHRGG